MKLVTIPIVFTLFILLGFTVNAEEKKIKLRGIEKTQEFKEVQINISPDLLKFDKFEKLKLDYKTAKNFAIKTDKDSKKRKNCIKVLQIILESLLSWFAPIISFTAEEIFRLINKND